MREWIGLAFSCAMILIAAMTKSGFEVLPAWLADGPGMQFKVFVASAAVATGLAMLAPSHSMGRQASMWSASALAVFVVVLNLDVFSKADASREQPVEQAVTAPEETAEKDDGRVVVTFKKTLREDNWEPFANFERRVREAEAEQPVVPETEDASPFQ